MAIFSQDALHAGVRKREGFSAGQQAFLTACGSPLAPMQAIAISPVAMNRGCAAAERADA